MKRLFLLAALCLPLAALAQTPDQPKLNKKNLIIREINTDPKGRNEMLDHETLYNADGHKLEEVEYDSDGKKKWTKRYTAGMMLLDLKDPSKVLSVYKKPLIVPDMPIETDIGVTKQK